MKKFTLIFSSVLFAAVFVLTTLSLQAETKRWVLVEEATNASCPPCAAQNPTFQAFLNNHRDRIIPLVYHWDYPGPNDPMFLENPTMNKARIENYYQINGVPSGRMNGKMATPTSSGWYDGAPGDTAALYTTLNAQPANSPFTMTVNETRTGSASEVTVNIDALSAISGKKLRVAVVEYHIYDAEAGSNGETDFYWIARQMLPTHDGTTVNMEAGESKSFTLNYTMKNTWDQAQIYIVAFLQDDMTKEVLQAATNLKVAYAQAEISDVLTKIPRNGELTKTVTITNPNDFQATFDLQLSDVPSGWVATLDKTQITLAAHASDDALITVNSSDQANFLIISVIATPSAEGYMGDPATTAFATMTDDAKYVVYSGFNSGAVYIMDGFAQNEDLIKDAVYVPWNLSSYYSPTDFDVAFFTIRNENAVTSSSQDNYLYPLYEELISQIKDMIFAGKSAFVSNEVTGYLINTYPSQLPNQLDFLKNYIGVNPTNTSLVRRWSGQSLSRFDLDGVTNDVIGNGISTQMNTSDYNYILFTDYLSIPSNSTAKPVFYYDNDQTHIGTVRVDKSGGAKIVYSTFGLETIADENVRGTVIKRIMDYFRGPVALGPVMAMSTSTLEFDSVKIDTDKELSIDINNEGDADLVISKLEFDAGWDEDGVFTLASGASSLPMTITPGTKKTIKVNFRPIEEKEYNGLLTVSSNDPNKNEEIVSLNGFGKLGTSVYEDNTSSNGLLALSAGPNPFSGSTKITVNVGGTTTRNINLAIMDAAGRIVANLANESMAPGQYVKEFNADALASGIYYILGTTDGASVRLQIVLNK